MLAAMKPLAEISLVEDNPADIDLTREVLAQNNHHLRLSAVQDGEQAISFLRRGGKFNHVPRPDIIVLDLSLPGMNGRNVLQELKSNQDLKRIPVIVFTSSQAQGDVART
jgi:two-component system, chemotaxis family, response regulator Rcp1